MANRKRSRRPRQRREPPPSEMSTRAVHLLRQVLTLLSCSKLPGRRSAEHLRRAAIEVLEAIRALLDEVMELLKQEKKAPSDLRRIRVEG